MPTGLVHHVLASVAQVLAPPLVPWQRTELCLEGTAPPLGALAQPAPFCGNLGQVCLTGQLTVQSPVTPQAPTPSPVGGINITMALPGLYPGPPLPHLVSICAHMDTDIHMDSGGFSAPCPRHTGQNPGLPPCTSGTMGGFKPYPLHSVAMSGRSQELSMLQLPPSQWRAQ